MMHMRNFFILSFLLLSNSDIDHGIESVGSPDKKAFMEIARERGMREAIVWRDARFAKAQE